jgi:hypothetical protein
MGDLTMGETMVRISDLLDISETLADMWVKGCGSTAGREYAEGVLSDQASEMTIAAVAILTYNVLRGVDGRNAHAVGRDRTAYADGFAWFVRERGAAARAEREALPIDRNAEALDTIALILGDSSLDRATALARIEEVTKGTDREVRATDPTVRRRDPEDLLAWIANELDAIIPQDVGHDEVYPIVELLRNAGHSIWEHEECPGCEQDKEDGPADDCDNADGCGKWRYAFLGQEDE